MGWLVYEEEKSALAGELLSLWVTGLVEWYATNIATAPPGLSPRHKGHEGLDENHLDNRKAVYEAASAQTLH